MQKMLQNTLISDGKTFALGTVKEEIYKIIGTSHLLGSFDMVFTSAQRVLDLLHHQLGLGCFVALEAFDEVKIFLKLSLLFRTILSC